MRSALKTATKKVGTAVGDGDVDTATERALEASRAFDKAASKGIVHKRTAARHKSRITKAANTAASSSADA